MDIADVKAVLRKTIEDVLADERFHYRTATVVENAPLALEQLVMETRADLAWKLLEMIEPGAMPMPKSRRGKKKDGGRGS